MQAKIHATCRWSESFFRQVSLNIRYLLDSGLINTYIYPDIGNSVTAVDGVSEEVVWSGVYLLWELFRTIPLTLLNRPFSLFKVVIGTIRYTQPCPYS
jgi:hypothetical protein